MSCPVICLITFLCQTLYLKTVLRLMLTIPSSRVAFPLASATHLEYQELKVTSLFSVTGISQPPGVGGGGVGGTDGRTDVKPSCRLGRDWHVPVQPSLGTFLWHRNSDLGVSAKSLASHSFPTSATRMFLSTTFGSPITLNPETPSLQLLAQ